MKLIVLAFALLLAACKTVTTSHGLSDPSDPAAPVAPVSYRSALDAYVSQRPVAPADWRQRNERVTPQPRGGQ